MGRTATTSKSASRTGITRHRNAQRTVPSSTWMLTLLNSSMLR